MATVMIRFLVFFAWFALVLAQATTAQEQQPVLVELFASQNCPACPKAHRTLQSVTAENEDVLVLTWSVDYWDYLGEADPMALPEAKARQIAYADRMKLRAPYTPQSVYDGTKQCPATRRKTVDQNIEARRQQRSPMAPRLTQIGDMVEISHPCDTPLDVVLVEYLPPEAHETGVVNPVIAKRDLGQCTREQTQFPVSCAQSCAVILQAPDYGEIFAALVLN